MDLPGRPHFPLETGTASALYFGQRIYQFPLGVFGAALGTVIFPLLSRHAGQGQMDRLRDDLSMGLRLVVGIGVPASAGIVLLARPLTVLFFERGEFDAAATEVTAGIIAAYGLGVWAYCGLLIVHRGFYAVGDRLTPLRAGMVSVVLNLVLSFALIWPLEGKGLALETAVSAMVQVMLAGWLLQKKIGRLDWRPIGFTTLKTLLATTAMGIVCVTTSRAIPESTGTWHRLFHLGATLAAAIATYLALARVIGLSEPWQLLGRRNE
jgi:putative peptidoglycan lipid II flippase